MPGLSVPCPAGRGRQCSGDAGRDTIWTQAWHQRTKKVVSRALPSSPPPGERCGVCLERLPDMGCRSALAAERLMSSTPGGKMEAAGSLGEQGMRDGAGAEQGGGTLGMLPLKGGALWGLWSIHRDPSKMGCMGRGQGQTVLSPLGTLGSPVTDHHNLPPSCSHLTTHAHVATYEAN
jgi:hypothetical protein